jgi:hypothetical protein
MSYPKALMDEQLAALAQIHAKREEDEIKRAIALSLAFSPAPSVASPLGAMRPSASMVAAAAAAASAPVALVNIAPPVVVSANAASSSQHSAISDDEVLMEACRMYSVETLANPFMRNIVLNQARRHLEEVRNRKKAGEEYEQQFQDPIRAKQRSEQIFSHIQDQVRENRSTIRILSCLVYCGWNWAKSDT